MKINKLNALMAVAITGSLLLSNGCKKKDETPEAENTTTTTTTGGTTGGSTTSNYVLVIDNGAQAMDAGSSISLTAHLVNKDGVSVTPGSVSWSSNIGAVSGNVFTATSETVGTISASTTHEGVTYTAAIPVNVQPSATTRLFGIAPSAIIWSTNAGNIQLIPVYLGTQSSSYSYVSENTNIVTVSSTGDITFKAVGTTNIKVTGTIGGKATTLNVPVMVVGPPDVPLPVVRVSLNPPVAEMFRNETVQLTAKAYNSAGADVSGSTQFAFSVVPKQEHDFDNGVPITVDANGKVTSNNNIGSAYVKVVGAGLMAQAEIVVNPDTAIMVSPFQVTLGTDFQTMQTVTTATLTATTYKVDRAKYKAKDPSAFTAITNSSSLKWDLPLTGVQQVDDMFKVVTIKSQNSNSAVIEAIQGKVGSSFVIAHAGTVGGGAAITVNP